MDDDEFQAIIGQIYDVALDRAAWPALLERLARAFRSHFADSFERSLDYRSFGGIAHGMDAADYNEVFLGVWVKRNVWGSRRPTVRAGDVVATRDITPVADLVRSEMYGEFLAPRDLHEGLRLDIWAADGTIEDISLLRPWSAGPYDASEIALAHALLPHLQRSAAVSRRLRKAEHLAEAGLAALEQTHTAMMLLDRRSRVVHANGAAIALLAAADGVAATACGLTGATPALTARLGGIIEAAIGRPGQASVSGALRLPRPSGRPALAVVALPLRPKFQASLLDGPPGQDRSPAVLCCVTDPQAGTDLKQGLLAALFGLSPAEASLASDLLAGHELRDIAESRGRSINTVRTQLASLMAKTDTSRQADLIRLLTRLPRGNNDESLR